MLAFSRPGVSLLSRRSIHFGLVIALLSCKGSEVAAPKAVPPAPLGTSQSQVQPYQTLSLTLAAGVVTQDRVAGTFGSLAVESGRVNDSTVALTVPSLPAGPYALTLTANGKAFRTTLQMQAAPQAANPAAVIDSVVTAFEVGIAAREAGLTGPLAVGAADTALIRRQITTLRTRIATLRADMAALSPAERAQVAGFFKANPEIFKAFDASASPATAATQSSLTLSGGACTEGKKCYDALDETLTRMIKGLSLLAGGMIAAKSASWLGGLASKITVEGVTIAAAGITLGYVFNGIADMARTPVRVAGTADDQGALMMGTGAFGSGLGSTSAAAPAPTFRNGTVGVLVVNGEYRSLTVSDLVSDPAASGIAQAFKAFQSGWASIVGLIPFLDLPTPTLPSTPLVRVVQPIPPAQLQLAGVTPSDFVGSATAAGTSWVLTFTNTRQGADHLLSLAVRFTPPGLPTQSLTRAILLQPERYGVMSVAIAEVAPEVALAGTKQLTAIARDSASRVMPVADLVGRMPTWASANTVIATVNATSGVVTGMTAGTTTITASTSGKQGSVAFKVVAAPDSTDHYKAMVVGNWTTTWYYGETGAFAQEDKLILRADGTGNVLSARYASGLVSSYDLTGPNSIKTTWSIQKKADGYHLSYYSYHFGKLTTPFSSFRTNGIANGYYYSISSR